MEAIVTALRPVCNFLGPFVLKIREMDLLRISQSIHTVFTLWAYQPKPLPVPHFLLMQS